jgi:hypothetical protein
MAVLGRALRQHHAAVLNNEVPIREADIDLPGLQLRAIGGGDRRKWAASIDDSCERARCVRRHMEHDKHREGEIGGQSGGELGERFDTACRRADRNDSVRFVTAVVRFSPHL